MKISDSWHNLSRIEFCSFFWEPSDFVQMCEKLSSRTEIHDEIHFLFGLKHIHHFNKEGVLSFHKNFFLEFCAFKLVVLNHYVLSNTFHCIDFTIWTFLNKKHFTETSFSDDFFDVEVLKAYINSFLVRVKSLVPLTRLFSWHRWSHLWMSGCIFNLLFLTSCFRH